MHQIKYRLSPAGQKASLLAGGDGKLIQIVEVQPGSTEFKALLAAEKVELSSDGQAALDLTPDYPRNAVLGYLDMPLDAAALLEAWAVKCQQASTARLRAEAEEKERQARWDAEDDATLAAYDALPLSERISPSGSMLNLPSLHHYSRRDQHPAYLEALAEQKRIEEAAAAKVQADREAAEARKKKWREDMGLEEDNIALKIEDNCLASVPPGCWESHNRGKNWFATIAVDPSAPGGLARTFHDKAKGDCYYLLPELTPGEAVEFGADYYSGSGRKSPTRWYGYVLRMQPPIEGVSSAPYLILCKCATGKQACKEGATYARENPDARLSPPDAVEAGLARINSEGSIVPSDD